jgi:GMP synthase (glutamine-hydrolysing)
VKQAHVIRHVAFEDLGSLAGVLEEQGYAVRYLEAGAETLDVARDADLLVVLGGPIGAYEDGAYPFVLDELRLLEHRLGRDLPTLGICLGAQLMARALGAAVYAGNNGKEIGWAPLALTPAGQDSPLAHLGRAGVAVLHWHGDTFDLPSGAVHLARTDRYANQAFSYGRRSLAVQFHPEVTQPDVERWFIGHACELGATPGVTVAGLRADTERYSASLAAQAVRVWRDWLGALAR